MNSVVRGGDPYKNCEIIFNGPLFRVRGIFGGLERAVTPASRRRAEAWIFVNPQSVAVAERRDRARLFFHIGFWRLQISV
jgi:hypothetical protein